jgi:hypothetical protein
MTEPSMLNLLTRHEAIAKFVPEDAPDAWTLKMLALGF